jgi:hypothetical protein
MDREIIWQTVVVILERGYTSHRFLNGWIEPDALSKAQRSWTAPSIMKR